MMGAERTMGHLKVEIREDPLRLGGGEADGTQEEENNAGESHAREI